MKVVPLDENGNMITETESKEVNSESQAVNPELMDLQSESPEMMSSKLPENPSQYFRHRLLDEIKESNKDKLLEIKKEDIKEHTVREFCFVGPDDYEYLKEYGIEQL